MPSRRSPPAHLLQFTRGAPAINRFAGTPPSIHPWRDRQQLWRLRELSGAAANVLRVFFENPHLFSDGAVGALWAQLRESPRRSLAEAMEGDLQPHGGDELAVNGASHDSENGAAVYAE